MKNARLRLASDRFVPEFGARGELRQKVGRTGRIHLDRWLSFLVIHRSEPGQASIARRVALNSPAYLTWSPDEDEDARHALDAVLPCLRENQGPVLLIEVEDGPYEDTEADSPELPAFELVLGASRSARSKKALAALTRAVCEIEIDLRHPHVKSGPVGPWLTGDAEDADRISLTIAPIHRAPDGQLYPQLTHDLVVNLVDALLRAAAAYMKSAGKGPPHHRSLGRSAFLAAALKADKKLDAIARSYDFLLSLTPINSREAMGQFFDHGEKKEPEFRYRPLTVDPDSAKRDLYDVDLTALEDPLLERLLCEKRRELDVQLTLLATRNGPGFRPASMLQYGTVGPQLLSDAHAILGSVRPRRTKGATVGAHQVAATARALIDRYRAADPRFDAAVEIRDDVSGLLVSGRRLMIASNTAMPETRMDALLAHEVSVHLLTYFNGATQGLTIFRTGLAHYEGVQEGLGVFAEWAVGGLTPSRLRLLAGRVVAVDAMIGGASFIEVYRRLTDDLGFGRKNAFDISMRAFRSGGFAKDAIYLKGFRQVMDHVASGASLDAFWLGKIAPKHIDAVDELLQRGLLHKPVFMPEFLLREGTQKRIEGLRAGLAFDQLLESE